MIVVSRVPSWGVSRIRRLGAMTIPAAEPDPDTRERASDAGGGDPPVPGRGEPRVVAAPERDGARAAPVTRRLRTAAPVQLEFVSDREGPGPEVVWASLPERAREQLLVLLARLIDSGAVEAEAEG